MRQIIGIRNGHRITITVTGPRGAITITRRHHPDCPCPTAATRLQTEEPPMPDQPPAQAWPTFTLQRWNWGTRDWDVHATYGPDARGEGNAYFAVSSERASQTGPIRLLKDGVEVLADDPETYYGDAARAWED